MIERRLKAATPKLADRLRERRWVFLLAAFVLMGVPADAQDAPALRPHAVVIGGGAIWSGGYGIGDATAELRGNGTGASPPPFTLLSTDSSLQSAFGVEARVGFTVTAALALEAGVGYASPDVAVAIADDAEASPTTLDAAETLRQYIVDGAVVWQLPVLRLGSRARPFVIGGGGYLRQLYDERTLVETGQIIYAGGGVRFWLRGGAGDGSSLGIRGDVRVNWRRQGVEFEGRTRTFPSVGVSLFWQP
jgi:hypothetical protein